VPKGEANAFPPSNYSAHNYGIISFNAAREKWSDQQFGEAFIADPSFEIIARPRKASPALFERSLEMKPGQRLSTKKVNSNLHLIHSRPTSLKMVAKAGLYFHYRIQCQLQSNDSRRGRNLTKVLRHWRS